MDKNNINYDIEWALNAIPFITKKTFFKDVIIKSINDIVGYEPQINNGGGTSDGRWIAPMGTEVVELGPINETIHQINEKVNIHDLDNLKKASDRINKTRPTAVNLSWALNEVMTKIAGLNQDKISIKILEIANQIRQDDISNCKKIGEYGCEVIKKIYNKIN